MAIGKWISFSQPVSTLADTSIPKPVPVPCTADGKQFGLENFGNTCYANSVLQALYFCAPFRDLVIQHTNPYTSLHNAFAPTSPAAAARRMDRKSTQDSSPPIAASHPPPTSVPSAPHTLFSALRALYLHISQNQADKGTIAPRAFIEKLRELNEGFRNTMHHDAHEFLNYLLNRMVEEMEEERRHRMASGDDLPRSMISSSSASHPPAMTASASTSSAQSPGATFIHQIFEGILTSETRCLTCENVSSRDESFLDLSIDIEQNSSVTACLRQFSASEMLCQKEKFFCDACCDLQEAERRMKIKRLPNVLALHLKRFKYQEDGRKHIKLTYRVAFPLELRLFNTVDDISNPDRLYELFAIVVHIGNGPNHGHYVSIIKTLGTWFIFDDETVDSIRESDIPKYFGDSNSGSAYVLYYQALDIDLTALGLRSPSPEPAVHPVQQSEPPQPWQPTDSPVSTPLSLPPGLNDPPVPEVLPQPITPSTQVQSPLAPFRKSPPRKVSSPLLTSTLGRPTTIGHTPLRGDTVLRTSRSAVLDEKFNSIPKPNISIPILPKDDLKPLQSSGGAANGRDRDTDKSMMSWFRLPFKTVRSRPSSEVNGDRPPLSRDILTAPSSPIRNQSTSSSSNSSKDSRQPLDSPIPSHRPPRVSPLPNGKLPSRSRTIDTSHYETNSRHSSASASSNTVPTSLAADRRSQPWSLPSVPASPQVPNAEQQLPAVGRMSLDHGRVPRRHARPSIKAISSPQLPKSLPRPATSTGSPTKTNPQPSVPNAPLPNSSSSAMSNSKMSTSQSEPSEGAALGRPRSAHASYGFLMLPPSTATPPMPNNATGSVGKRSTRKLSLTAPMLGLKRRDKDQQ